MDLLRLLQDSGGAKSVNGGVKDQNQFKIGGANHKEAALLETIGNMPGLNAPALASALNWSLRTTQRLLGKLMDSEKIEFRGASKNGGYFYINHTSEP